MALQPEVPKCIPLLIVSLRAAGSPAASNILHHRGGLGKFQSGEIRAPANNVDWARMGSMPEDCAFARIVLTTTPNSEEAARVARTLVEERLAACATLIPSVRSIYRWQGKVEESTETMLLIKTSTEQLAALEARILALHSYETPEFLVLPIESGSFGYLDWLRASLSRP
jgi:periplasmic divalent cation tolerance protein